jgi:hypothetical protein
LFTQIVAGAQHYDFKLSAMHRKGDEWHFHFEIRSVPISEEHTEHQLYFPFSALPWLRQKMVKMLADHDGSERIGEMTKIPEWATRDVSPVH